MSAIPYLSTYLHHRTGMRTGAAMVENTTESLRELTREVPHEPAIPLLGMYPEKMKMLYTVVHVHPCVHCRIICNNQDVETICVISG